MAHVIIPRADWGAVKPRSRHLIETPPGVVIVELWF